MKKTILILLLVFLPLYVLVAQIDKGNTYYDTYMYDLAKDCYEKVRNNLKAPKDIADINYKLGICYKQLGDSDKSERYFKVAVEANKEARVLKPIVLLFYADALRMNGKYEEAINYYKQYLKSAPQDHRARAGLKSCTLVPQWISRPTRYKVLNVSKFNSMQLDFAPSWSTKDRRGVLFTSSREGTMGSRSNYKSGQRFTDIFETAQDRKGNWSEPVPLTGVNTEEDEGAATVSMKGSDIFFTRCKAGKKVDEPCKIFYATKKGTSWSEPVQVHFPGFENYEVGYPALAPDNKTIYFSAETPEGKGGMDIFRATRNGTIGCNFGKPVNLFEINTLGDEVFPTVRSNGDLYFASDGHSGMGGLDIYKATTDERGNITGVVNMKYPINSSYDDFGIIFNGDDESGYFTSNRRGGKGGDDIYSFYLPPLVVTLSGTVKDTTDPKVTRNVKEAKITLESLGGKDNKDKDVAGGIVAQLTSSDKGTFVYELKADCNYRIKAEKEDYFAGSVEFHTFGIEYDTVITALIKMGKIPRVIVLPNIEYEYDKADLLPESMVSLDMLVETLNDNPNITIELRSHTDFRGQDDYNMELSLARAKSCVDYLISKGIAADRLTAKGYGESDPRVINYDLATQFPQFKEGDVLSEDYINKIRNNEQKEFAHQLNRRTEFSVLSTDYGQKDDDEETPQSDTDQPAVKKKTGTVVIDSKYEDDF